MLEADRAESAKAQSPSALWLLLLQSELGSRSLGLGSRFRRIQPHDLEVLGKKQGCWARNKTRT